MTMTNRKLASNDIKKLWAYLEMYDGTTAVKAAARRPAEDLFVTSIVSQYDEIAALAEKIGAMKTHMFLILIVTLMAFNAQ